MLPPQPAVPQALLPGKAAESPVRAPWSPGTSPGVVAVPVLDTMPTLFMYLFNILSWSNREGAVQYHH